MIYDNIKRASLYYSLGERIAKALQYLEQTDFSNVEPGKYEIDGDNVFALVQASNTKPLSACKWEAHKKYIDIQFMVTGQEKMGFSESTKVFVLEEYNKDKDCIIYKGNGNYLTANEGHFALFFPSDIHMPSIAINIPKEIKKVVIKVKVEGFVEEVLVEKNAQQEITNEEPTV
jgi:YhcH/YjgK/YiaL family protein